MDLTQAIYTRRAVRKFTDAPVGEAMARQLVDAAIQAPSAVNQQPWKFCIISDRSMLDRISDEAKQHMLQTSHAALSHHFQEILGDKTFNIFYHAPLLILICSETEGPWAVENCALAAQNLMLAARGANLGTCWIGFAQGWLQTARAKSLLGMPAEWVPVAPIIVGHPASEPPAVARKAPEMLWIGK